ncbi:hypothetical protein EAX61_00785 [Dokdonia sinensis]|uniref:GLPGLI family protein n=1 Tax=Dokdonia sinensis TaxID=2479847 RepID=A0A3M0GRW3_9FLAO|nr:hypothetical protein [Dokdonia sinensis]RMB63949.1 hypothetical protein EAX61_00785 [Dokdonia sinensis]
MRIILILFYFLSFTVANAQNWSVINADLNLSDSLTFPTEIRIYQGGGITNYNSVFRMYEDGPNNWTAEFHEHWTKIDGVMDKKIAKRNIQSKSDIEYVHLNIRRSYIYNLPSRKDIQWKLMQRGEIKKVERFKRGKTIQEYDILSKVIMPLDGTGYYFQAKSPYESNEFEFGNPERFKELYPEIDEPKYVCELIEIIRSEFGIWQK